MTNRHRQLRIGHFRIPACRWLVLVVLGLIIMLGLSLRAADLYADPPLDLSWSFGPFTDEALNSYSARNAVLHGNWKTDDFFPFVVYPLFSLIAGLAFRLFGIGFSTVRLISVTTGVGSIAVFYLLVRNHAGRLAGLIAALLLATCYPLVMYSRLGLVETLQLLFLLLTGYFFQRSIRGLETGQAVVSSDATSRTIHLADNSNRPPPGWPAALAGFFAVGSVLLVKTSAAFILPVIAALMINAIIETRKTGAGRPASGLTWAVGYPPVVRYGLLGAGVAVIIWLALVVIPHGQEYVNYILRHSLASPTGSPDNLAIYLLNTFTIGGVPPFAPDRIPLLPKIAFTALLGYLLLPGLLSSRLTGSRFLFGWFISGLLMLGYFHYRPTRYEIILLPPLIAAVATGLARLIRHDRLLPASCGQRTAEADSPLPTTRPGISYWLRQLGWTAWLWPLAVQLLIFTNGAWGLLKTAAGFRLLIYGLVTAVAFNAVRLAVIRLFRAHPASQFSGYLRPAFVRFSIAGLLLLAIQWLDLSQFNRWHDNRSYDLLRYSRELDIILPEDAVVAGSWAPTLLMESKKKALCLTDWANINDPVGRFGVTHIASHGLTDIRLLEPAWPEIRDHLQPIWQRPLRGTKLTVFEILNQRD